MNAPDREENVILDETEEVKVAYSVNPKIENSANFIICKEDHTIGNIMRMKLLEDEDVMFAGYRHPHPLETLIEMKVRTNGSKDPPAAMKDATHGLLLELNTLSNRFKEARTRFIPENQYQEGMDMMR